MRFYLDNPLPVSYYSDYRTYAVATDVNAYLSANEIDQKITKSGILALLMTAQRKKSILEPVKRLTLFVFHLSIVNQVVFFIGDADLNPGRLGFDVIATEIYATVKPNCINADFKMFHRDLEVHLIKSMDFNLDSAGNDLYLANMASVSYNLASEYVESIS